MGTRFRSKSILSVHEQAARMRAFPGFKAKVRGAVLTAVGDVQPTEVSEVYRVKIEYQVWEPPSVWVTSPQLTCRENAKKIPHMYGQRELCLYLPGSGEWSGDLSLGHTLIPWISEWLFFYEMWHATGEWLGGGVEPAVNEPIRNGGERNQYERADWRR